MRPPFGKVYMQAVIDTYGGYAFGFLYVRKLPECAVAVLHNDVIPFYQDRRIKIDAILTDNGREFRGTADIATWARDRSKSLTSIWKLIELATSSRESVDRTG